MAAPSNIAGMVVFIDPGHNGSNDASINRQVPTGRGGTKDCQTSGTATNTGYKEHTFTWDTALRVRAELNALGVPDRAVPRQRQRPGTVRRRTRQHGQRAAPQRGPVHPRRRRPAVRPGFHVNYSAPPLNQVQAGPSVQYARIMRDQLQASGIPPANYIGQNGLYGAFGPDRPEPGAVSVDPGRVRQHEESRGFGADGVPEGRQKYADALVRGVAGFLASQGQAR